MRHIQIYRLRNKRREVERTLREEQRSPRPDEQRVARLWRQKLELKAQLVRLGDP